MNKILLYNKGDGGRTYLINNAPHSALVITSPANVKAWCQTVSNVITPLKITDDVRQRYNCRIVIIDSPIPRFKSVSYKNIMTAVKDSDELSITSHALVSLPGRVDCMFNFMNSTRSKNTTTLEWSVFKRSFVRTR